MSERDQVLREAVLQAVRYEPDSEKFYWNENRSNVKAGTEAGSLARHGYICIRIDKVRYYAHRLAWLVMTGALPDGTIDHSNRDRSDNRWSNLRVATQRQNLGNMVRRSAKGLPKGVCMSRERFQAQIRVNGKRKHLGVFSTPELAHEAYMVAAKEVFGDFAIGS